MKATLASIRAPNTPEGLSQLHPFAVPFASRRWAIEGAGHHFIAVLVGQLLERSEGLTGKTRRADHSHHPNFKPALAFRTSSDESAASASIPVMKVGMHKSGLLALRSQIVT